LRASAVNDASPDFNLQSPERLPREFRGRCKDVARTDPVPDGNLYCGCWSVDATC
jgi:hypothetical protein